MRKHEASEERERSIFNNLVVVVVFTSLILGFIFYFNERLQGVEEDKEFKAILWKKRRRRPLLAPPALLTPSSLVL